MIDFFISRITIENFRGIKSLQLDLDPAASTVLIGPNNSGKSSLLDAFGMCLSSPKFFKYTLCDDDFWCAAKSERTSEFKIEVFFEQRGIGQLPAVKGGVGDPVEVHGIRTVGTRESSELSRTLLDENGTDILLTKSAPISKSRKEQFKGMGLSGRRYAKMFDIQDRLPEIWHLDAKNLFVSLYEWKTGPLQRLLKIYKEKLFREEWTTSTSHEMPKALHSAFTFLETVALQTPFWKETLAIRLAESFRRFLGQRTNIQAAPGLSPIESWIQSNLEIRISPSQNLAPVDTRHLGDGWQSLMRLAALELAIELSPPSSRTLLLVEEPETYLHPHLRRRLRSIFQRFESNGHQTIISTHSSELISFAEEQQIVRLTMGTSGVEKQVHLTRDSGQAFKDQEKLYERGNHEMVFAGVPEPRRDYRGYFGAEGLARIELPDWA